LRAYLCSLPNSLRTIFPSLHTPHPPHPPPPELFSQRDTAPGCKLLQLPAPLSHGRYCT
jgi:hypothetical protein